MKFGVSPLPRLVRRASTRCDAARAGGGGRAALARGPRPRTASTPSSSPAGSRTATTCAPARSPGFAPVMEEVAEFAARRRPRARDLQRLPGAVRGRSAARGAAAEHLAAVRLPPGRRSRSSTPTPRSRARATPDSGSRSRSSTRPAATTRPSAPPARGERPGLLRYAPGENPNGSLRRHRRRRNERGQRVRPDAASGARRRPADRLHRRPEDLRVDASACRRRASPSDQPPRARAHRLTSTS